MNKAALSLLIATIPAASNAQLASSTCEIDGITAFAKAKTTGFLFGATSSDAASCEIYKDTSTIIISSKKDKPSSCRFLILGGRSLSSNWKLVAVNVSGAGVTTAIPPGQPPSESGRLIVIAAQAGETKVVSILSLKLKGDSSCADVSAAFD
jgi:hypothetical protein